MSGVQSISRAFALLNHLANGPATISALARTADLPNTTVTRILKTLQLLEVVERNPDGTFALGSAARRLSEAASTIAGDVRSIDQARLVALTAQVGEITGLSVRDGRHVHYIAQIDGPHEVQVRDWTGERIPLHVVSSGLVFLAGSNEHDVADYLNDELERFTPQTQTDPDAVLERLRHCRDDGVIWTKEEFHTGINSVAAPIYNSQHQVAAALHSHGPSYRFPKPNQQAAIAAAIKQTAASLSHSLGWTGQRPETGEPTQGVASIP